MSVNVLPTCVTAPSTEIRSVHGIEGISVAPRCRWALRPSELIKPPLTKAPHDRLMAATWSSRSDEPAFVNVPVIEERAVVVLPALGLPSHNDPPTTSATSKLQTLNQIRSTIRGPSP